MEAKGQPGAHFGSVLFVLVAAETVLSIEVGDHAFEEIEPTSGVGYGCLDLLVVGSLFLDRVGGYLCIGGFDDEDVEVAGVAAYCQPVALSAEGYRVDGRKLVASSDLLDHRACFCIEDSHLIALLRSRC